MTPEFSRLYPIEAIGPAPRSVALEAEQSERAALAQRFGLVAIHSLTAQASLSRRGEVVRAEGLVRGAVTQSCIATGEPVDDAVEAPFLIEFRPPPADEPGEAEVELDAGELDVAFYEGAEVDVGEAVAETLSLALDPYPRAPGADAALREAGVKSEEQAGPFAALAALKDKMTK